MGKHRLVPHLIVEGGLDAIDFYERAFGAEKTALKLAQDGKRVMHAELEVNGGGSNCLTVSQRCRAVWLHPAPQAALLSPCISTSRNRSRLMKPLHRRWKRGRRSPCPQRIHSGALVTDACAIHLAMSGLFMLCIRRRTQMSIRPHAGGEPLAIERRYLGWVTHTI